MDLVNVYNKYKKSLHLLIKWGYQVSICDFDKNKVEYNYESDETFLWTAKKKEKVYCEIDPLRLLAIVIISEEYPLNTDEEFYDLPDLYLSKLMK